MPGKKTFDQIAKRNIKLQEEICTVCLLIFKSRIWWALRREGVMEKEVLAITEVYKYIITLVRINSEKLKNKPEIRVH